MNVDENPVTPFSYRVNGIPTINVYQNGEVVRSIVGARPKAALLNELSRVHRGLSLTLVQGSASDRVSGALRASSRPVAFTGQPVSPASRGPGVGRGLRGRPHDADQLLQGGLDLVAPGQRRAQVHPHPRVVGRAAGGS